MKKKKKIEGRPMVQVITLKRQKENKTHFNQKKIEKRKKTQIYKQR